MSLFAMFRSAGPTGFGYGSTAERVTEGLSLAGQTILVTGCNSGIGQEATTSPIRTWQSPAPMRKTPRSPPGCGRSRRRSLRRSEDEASARMRRRFNALLIYSWRDTQCRTRR
jgi:hypothetical protein